MWGPGAFTTYYRGYPSVLGAEAPHSFNNVLLKAHTHSKGWVRLTGPNAQDKLEVNKVCDSEGVEFASRRAIIELPCDSRERKRL